MEPVTFGVALWHDGVLLCFPPLLGLVKWGFLMIEGVLLFYRLGYPLDRPVMITYLLHGWIWLLYAMIGLQ